MASTHVLRIRRTDGSPDHLLVNVTQKSNIRPLDLKLVATDHEHLYHGSVKSSNLVALQASKYNGGEDEWEQVLTCTLLQQRPEVNPDALQSLEVVAAVNGETCTLTLRNNIGGITTRLGAIVLTQDDEKEEVSAFEWVDTAAAASDELRNELATLHLSLGSQQTQVAKLTTQLDALVKAKKEHEEQLLRKCAVLLDSKRAKIREQQRELNAISKAHGHKAGASSRGKRKANEPSPDLDEDERAALGFNGADEDADDGESEAEEEDGQRTPEQETEDDGSDEGFAAPLKVEASQRNISSSSTQGRQYSARADDMNASKDGGDMDVDVSDLPPRRELPFARRRLQGNEEQKQEIEKKHAPAPAPEEDDSDDDEL
jgi:hypothetical protein